jgi:cysteine desulfurase/selenocysteine lyase
MSKINWDKYRQQFPVTTSGAYFMTAGAGAIPQPVLTAIHDQYLRVSLRGGDAFGENYAIMEACRKDVAASINARPEQIAFIPNVSFGVNALALSAKINRSQVIVNKDDFPSNILPWKNSSYVLSWVSSCGDRQVNFENSLAQADNLDSIIMLSTVGYLDGYYWDLGRISALKKNRPLIVNSTQGAGLFPLDVLRQDIDAVVCSCYKWLCCSEGLSYLYISDKFFNQLSPALVGWRSVKSAMSFDENCEYYKSARIFELGWDNMTVFSGYRAAFSFLLEIGFDSIRKRVLNLVSYLYDLLDSAGIVYTRHPKENRSGIVQIGPIEDADKLAKRLLEKNVFVNSRNGSIRISIHFYNNEVDLTILVEELQELLMQPKRSYKQVDCQLEGRA